MNKPAARSIEAYLEQLREALHGQDAAVIYGALRFRELSGDLASSLAVKGTAAALASLIAQ